MYCGRRIKTIVDCSGAEEDGEQCRVNGWEEEEKGVLQEVVFFGPKL